MSCEACKDILVNDDVEPDCFDDDKGCRIPMLDQRELRIIDIRGKLVSLRGLIDSGIILEMYDATREDIEMIIFIEDEIQKMNEEGKNG